jgi:hypothetical protein
MDLKKHNVKKMQGKFSEKIKKHSKGLSLPEYKTLKDISKGIISSGSVIVRQISTSLHEKISLEKTCERLYRNLKNEKICNIVSENILKSNCSKATDNTYFLVDESDIIKPHSNKIEGLTKVRDGSTGKWVKGFNLLNITSLTDTGKHYSIKPICSQLYSNKIEIDTVKNILEDRITEITVHSENKGTFVFDRGYDSRKLLELLSNNGNNYIIRSTGIRGLIVDGLEQNFKSVAKKVNLTYRYKDTENNNYSCGLIKVKIRTNPHKVKNPDTIETNLIIVRHNKSGGFFYLFCDFNDDTLTKMQIIEKALRGYRLRWKIEEFHRHVKQEFHWEEMQLMSYIGLKNLNTILMIAIDLVYDAIEYIDELMYLYPEFVGKKKRSYEYVYYKLSRIVKYIFSNLRIYRHMPYKGDYHDKLQLRINFS